MRTKRCNVSINATKELPNGLYRANKRTSKKYRWWSIISSKELKRYNIPTIYLIRMVEKVELIRVDRGIYMDSSGDYDEYYFFSSRYNVPIFSYVSALYLHEFTDIIPQETEVTVYKGYHPYRISGNIIIHYVTKGIYDLGIV